jgi:hypothetical protein
MISSGFEMFRIPPEEGKMNIEEGWRMSMDILL